MRRFPRIFTEERFPRLEPGSHTIINIRGGKGSGKTHLMQRLMEKFGATPLIGTDGRVWAYQVHWEPEFYILGRYDSPIGGCDVIRSMDQVQASVLNLANKGHVLFEGLLISTMSSRWIKMVNSCPDFKFIFATFKTPLEKCIKRVAERERELGNTSKNPVNIEHITAKYLAVQAAHLKLQSAGMDTRLMPSSYTVNTIVNWLLESANRSLPEDRLRILAEAVLKQEIGAREHRIARRVLGA
jgi:hypothetical protein